MDGLDDCSSEQEMLHYCCVRMAKRNRTSTQRGKYGHIIEIQGPASHIAYGTVQHGAHHLLRGSTRKHIKFYLNCSSLVLRAQTRGIKSNNNEKPPLPQQQQQQYSITPNHHQYRHATNITASNTRNPPS